MVVKIRTKNIVLFLPEKIMTQQYKPRTILFHPDSKRSISLELPAFAVFNRQLNRPAQSSSLHQYYPYYRYYHGDEHRSDSHNYPDDI